jgi:DNA-binding MarR family transcriptional regulator
MITKVKKGKTEKLSRRQKALREIMGYGRSQGKFIVALNEAIAKQLNLTVTDIVCLEILIEKGMATPGELAQVTGLTTGGITGAIERMEKAGQIKYERDTEDKRKVIITPLIKNMWWYDSYLKRIFSKIEQLHKGYSTKQLEMMAAHHKKVGEIVREEIERVNNDVNEK